MVMMQDYDDEQEVRALRKLLRSGPRTNRARPSSLTEEPKAPPPSENDHIEQSQRLVELLQSPDRLDEAEPLLRQELQKRESDYGFGHPHTLVTVTSLAMLLQAKGEIDEPMRLFKRVVEAYEEHDDYGKEHTDTLNAVNNLAVFLKHLGRYEKALPLYERVLKGDEKSHGEKHPHTLDSVYNLARLYDAIGERDKAVPLYRRELAGCEEHYGKSHQETAHSATNLANVLVQMGELEDADRISKEYGLVIAGAAA